MNLAGCAYGFDDDYSTTIREENKQLRAEINEQARLLGISAEKELALRAENERMKAELAKAKKDVERYRWLRNNPVWVGYDSDFRPDEIDAAIDAAMKGK